MLAKSVFRKNSDWLWSSLKIGCGGKRLVIPFMDECGLGNYVYTPKGFRVDGKLVLKCATERWPD